MADAAAVGHPLWHILVVVLAPVALIVGLTRYDRVRYNRSLAGSTGAAPDHPRERGALDPRLVMVALASAIAALIHADVCAAHFGESTLFGVFFLVIAVFQFFWSAALLLHPARSLLLVGVAVNLAVVVVWLVTRTVGLPFGPEAGEAESLGVLDAVASALEVLVVALAAAILRHGHTTSRPLVLRPDPL